MAPGNDSPDLEQIRWTIVTLLLLNVLLTKKKFKIRKKKQKQDENQNEAFKCLYIKSNKIL